MKILTDRQYEEAINEAINRFSERRDEREYVNARLREVEEELRGIRSAIDEQRRRIDRIEEIFSPTQAKTKSSRIPEAVTVPLIFKEGESDEH